MSRALEYLTKLQNQRVLVLGGTSGIGFCVAEAALTHGAHVIVSSSNSEKLSRAVNRLQAVTCPLPKPSGSVTGIACDLGAAGSLEANLTRLLDDATDGGTQLLDHAVYTAGEALQQTRLADADAATLQRRGLVRVVGPVLLAKLLPSYQHQRPASSLTLTGGIGSHRPSPGWSILSGLGASVEGLARGLAVDLKPVRVNLVAPGAVHTELLENLAADTLPALLERFKKDSLTDTVGRPEDVAEIYLSCLKSHFITGSVIIADGGRLLV
jgi:NAD(P)-dependent dehydrogenase (short-subunit alcohol dehydrogenase family)